MNTIVAERNPLYVKENTQDFDNTCIAGADFKKETQAKNNTHMPQRKKSNIQEI